MHTDPFSQHGPAGDVAPITGNRRINEAHKSSRLKENTSMLSDMSLDLGGLANIIYTKHSHCEFHIMENKGGSMEHVNLNLIAPI